MCFFIVVGWNMLLENFEGFEGGTTLSHMVALLTFIKYSALALVRDNLYF